LTVAPMVWPIGQGKEFAGTYDLNSPRVRQIEQDPEGVPVSGPDDPLIPKLVKPDTFAKWRDEIDLVKDLCQSFDRKAFLEGHLSPVYFGSALKNFGVRDLLEALIAYAPPPRDQQAAGRVVHATEPKMTGIVFKIQANMDPNHRDRIAFMRLASGKLTRGMKVKLVRTGKTVALNAPQFFFAQDRSIADEAYAGDVVGIPNHGLLRIGDTLTEGEDVVFTGVPSFAPEILRRVKLGDPMKAKKLREALEQLAEEGVVQLFIPADGSPAIVGVVGALQLDVLADRLANEYGVPVSFESARYEVMRWISSEDRKKLDEFIAANRFSIAHDLDGDPVFMAQSAFSLNYTLERAPEIRTTEIKEMHKAQ
jgi:peptide chain release factor 3